jgi:hypothetical protein
MADITITMTVKAEFVSDLDPSGLTSTPAYEIRQALAAWGDSIHITYGRPRRRGLPGANWTP